MKNISINTLVAAAILSTVTCASAAVVVCVPKDESKSWIKKISIDTESKKVALEIERFRTRDSVILGKLDAVLESVEDTRPDASTYAFNAYPSPGIEVTNIFKLYKVFNEWRLIEAGLVYVRDKPTLRAIGTSQVFGCTKR